jgi:hypothetical protein
MARWPQSHGLITFVDRLLPISIGGAFDGMGDVGAPAAAAWPAANEAIYVPFRVAVAMNIVSMDVINGGTLSGNIDAGIYSEDGRLLTSSGSTAQNGIGVTQNFNFTDVHVNPGLYFAAVALDNGTGQIQRWNLGNNFYRAVGVVKQATAFPLPATATFAATDRAYCPLLVVYGDNATIIANPTSKSSIIVPGRTIHPYSRESVGASLFNNECGHMKDAASVAWPANNDMVAYPFVIQKRTAFGAFWVFSGTNSGNLSMAIYGPSGVRLVTTGAVANNGGNNVLQVVLSSFTLDPGQYYCALSGDTTAASYKAVVPVFAIHFNPTCALWYTTAHPCPATIGSGVTNVNIMPLFGIGRGSVI